MTFHPSGDHLAVVCQGKVEDEAFFFCRREGADGRGKWEMRRDVGIGGVGGYFGSEEVSKGGDQEGGVGYDEIWV